MKLKKITAAAMCVSLLLTGCSGLSGKRGLTYSDTLFDTTIKGADPGFCQYFCHQGLRNIM